MITFEIDSSAMRAVMRSMRAKSDNPSEKEAIDRLNDTIPTTVDDMTDAQIVEMLGPEFTASVSSADGAETNNQTGEV